MRTKQNILVWGIVLAGLLSGCGREVPQATETHTIYFAQQVNDFIILDEAHSYQFTAQRGDQIKIALTGDGDNVCLDVLNISNERIVDNCAANTFLKPGNDVEAQYTITDDGQYTIVVSTSRRENTEYTLRLTGKREGMELLEIDPNDLLAVPDDVGAIDIGEIIISQTGLHNVIDVNTIELPNCNGTSELVVRKNYTKDVEHSVTIGTVAGIDLSIAAIKARLETQYVAEDSRVLTESIEAEMRAAPGTMVTYEIEWIEVAMSGLVEVISGDSTVFVPFTVNESLQANIRPPVQTPCSIG